MHRFGNELDLLSARDNAMEPERDEPTVDELFDMREAELEIRESERRVIEVSGEELSNYLQDPKFTRALRSAAKATNESGHETGFLMLITREKKLLIPEVVEGQTDYLDYSRVLGSDVYADANSIMKLDLSVLRSFPDAEVADLVDLHLHPNLYGSVAPTEGDLKFFDSVPGMLGREASPANMAIGVVRGDLKVELLIVQKSRPDATLSEEYLDHADELLPQEMINQLLEKSGYATRMVSLIPEGRSYKIQQLEEVKKNLLPSMARFYSPDELDLIER